MKKKKKKKKKKKIGSKKADILGFGPEEAARRRARSEEIAKEQRNESKAVEMARQSLAMFELWDAQKAERMRREEAEVGMEQW